MNSALGGMLRVSSAVVGMWRVDPTMGGYHGHMSQNENATDPGEQARKDAERDLSEHERPEVGLIADEDLPEDLQPTDDNPLAKNPGDADDEDDEGGGAGLGGAKVEGMPDMGNPGAPA